MDADVQYGRGCAVWRRVCSTQICHNISVEEAHLQYGCKCGVWRRHTISKDGGVQCGAVTLSIQTRVCSTGPSKLLRTVVDDILQPILL